MAFSWRWRLWALGLGCLFGLSGGGCGARTGLLDYERDAGTDADEPDAPYGEFPCTYGRSGEMVPIGTRWPATTRPNAVWVPDRFDVVYGVEPDSMDENIQLCSAEADPFLSCVETMPMASPSDYDSFLATREGGYGLCWTAGYRPWGDPRLDLFDDDRRPIGVGVELGGSGTACAGLGWSGDLAVVLLAHEVDVMPNISLQQLDPWSGDTRHLMEAPLTADGVTRVSLDVTDDLIGLGWVDDDGQHLAILDDELVTIEQLSTDNRGEISVSVRGEHVGVLWTVHEGPATDVRFALSDGSSGGMVELALVATEYEEVGPIELEAVWDGFLVGYWRYNDETEQLVVVPMRFAEEGGMDVRSEIVIHEGYNVGSEYGLSMTDDGHVGFVAASFMEPTWGLDQVHLQLLSCHR